MAPSRTGEGKRFYKSAEVAECEGGSFDVLLDGRPIKTPASRTLSVPTRALAEVIADEWNRQGDTISPTALPFTRLANSAIDGVAGRKEEVVSDIVNYAATDLLCYRATNPSALAAEQARLWDPILDWVDATFKVRLLRSANLHHVAQPQDALDAIRHAISSFDVFQLAAFHVMTSLTGSALIPLAHVEGFLDAHAAWAAAHADENWQMVRWGPDFEANQRQKSRFGEFQNSSQFFNLA